MTLEAFNRQSKEKAKEDLLRCCSSNAWADRLLDFFPFHSIEDLKIHSDKTWFSLEEKDWLEAFAGHPKIGEKNLKGSSWAKDEQSSVNNAKQATLGELEKLNEAYFQKFGFIFIICATGKTTDEMLAHLKERIHNDKAREMHNAANEQNLITHLRIDKLFS